jgi:hypothetical protein
VEVAIMSATTYPVRVDARRDSSLSRWLWLVKWFLAIPHYVVLGFLWLAFVVLSAVGMNRWVLRVAAYAGLMTDQYPPFRLDMGGSEPAGTLTLPSPGLPAPLTGIQDKPGEEFGAAPVTGSWW